MASQKEPQPDGVERVTLNGWKGKRNIDTNADEHILANDDGLARRYSKSRDVDDGLEDFDAKIKAIK